jgi:hypothetical protein
MVSFASLAVVPCREAAIRSCRTGIVFVNRMRFGAGSIVVW